jgi:hypothetical protein
MKKFIPFCLLLLSLSACSKYERWRVETALETLEGNWDLVSISTKNADDQLVAFRFFQEKTQVWEYAACDMRLQTFCEGREREIDAQTRQEVKNLPFTYRFLNDREIFERNGQIYTVKKLNNHKFVYYYTNPSNQEKTYYEFKKND